MPVVADAARVLEEALALTADERARIAHQLIHSLEPEDADAAAAWNEELHRRVDEIESGTADLEDWASVRIRLAAAARA
jgi:putative addiction module component (TIGR02574 family)